MDYLSLYHEEQENVTQQKEGTIFLDSQGGIMAAGFWNREIVGELVIEDENV